MQTFGNFQSTFVGSNFVSMNNIKKFQRNRQNTKGLWGYCHNQRWRRIHQFVFVIEKILFPIYLDKMNNFTDAKQQSIMILIFWKWRTFEIWNIQPSPFNQFHTVIELTSGIATIVHYAFFCIFTTFRTIWYKVLVLSYSWTKCQNTQNFAALPNSIAKTLHSIELFKVLEVE